MQIFGKLTQEQIDQFFIDHPAHPQNLVDQFNESSPEQKGQGVRWYPGANHAAHAIAKMATENTGKDVNADQVVGMIANHSGQNEWHANLLQAIHAAHGIFPGENGKGWRSPVDGTGFLSDRKKAEIDRQILAGGDWRQLVSKNKIGNFGQNISTGGIGQPAYAQDGGIDPNSRQSRDGRVNLTNDRHHVSALHGNYAPEDIYKALKLGVPANYDRLTDMTTAATAQINRENGTNITPVDLQATVWGTQQAKNEAQGYTSIRSANLARDSAINNKNRLAAHNQLHNDSADHVGADLSLAPGTGFTGAGGSSLPTADDIPVVQTYHGMPAHNGNPPTVQNIPRLPLSGNQAYIGQQIANQAAAGVPKDKQRFNLLPDDPANQGKTYGSYMDAAAQLGHYDSSGPATQGHIDLANTYGSKQLKLDNPEHAAAIAAAHISNYQAAPAPEAATQQAVARRTAWFVRQTSWFVRKTASTKPFFVRI